MITGLRRLTGGANAATWSFDYADRALVLRQEATESEENEVPAGISAIGLKAEAELMSKAAEYGIRAPRIYGVTSKDGALGNAVLMERVNGEALPQKLFKDPRYEKALSGLTVECGQTLAKIHAIPTSEIAAKLETKTPEKAVSIAKEQFREFGKSSAILASALRWMEENCPPPTDPVLLHGDFRMGNLLIDEAGISSVLDWELSNIGDPASDLAYFCAAPWRFGRYKKQAGGVGSIEALVSAYEQASGEKIDLSRVLWWRLYASVNWCLMCMIMANLWRSHSDRELERIVIGTRVSESEIDVLLIFDEIYALNDKFDPEISLTPPPESKAHTTPVELAEAIIECISNDVIPSVEGRDNFKARVARNAMGILKRDIAASPTFNARQSARLETLGMTEQDLVDQLLDGSLSLQSEDIRLHLKRSALEQISIDQPKYAGFKVALENWSTS